MKVIAAYLLAVLGGNAHPDAGAVNAILSAAGIEADAERVSTLISELSGKDVFEVIAAGKGKLASVPSVGASSAPSAGASSAPSGGAAAAAPKEEEKKKEEEPKEEEDEVGVLLPLIARSLELFLCDRTISFVTHCDVLLHSAVCFQILSLIEFFFRIWASVSSIKRLEQGFNCKRINLFISSKSKQNPCHHFSSRSDPFSLSLLLFMCTKNMRKKM